MKNILIYIVGLAVIILLTFALIGMFRKMNRITDNFETAIQQNNSQYYELTKKEFKELESTLSNALYEKIKDSLNLKIKHIERTITHEYKYTYDTTFTSLISHENTPFLYFDKDIDSCLSISGHIQDTLIYFDKITVDYQAQTVFYWKRKHKIIGIPFGKKVYEMITLNKCKGANESEVMEINIEKK
jgi:uncharacterized protein YxeA